MPAKKKTVKPSEPSEPRRFQVRRAFAFEGTYYARNNESKIADLPEFEIEDRLARGHIVEQRNRAAPPTTETE